jgi:hypothetical protein
MTIDLSRLDCVHCHMDGAVTLGGPLLAHFEKLDALFGSWALEEGGTGMRFPDYMPIAMMQRAGYLGSFPHLATFVAPLSGESLGRLRAIPAALRADELRSVDAAALESPVSMLAPAACFHAYASLQDEDLPAPRILTMRGTCYRREQDYAPLRRQYAFAMRELVCVGSAAEVEAFVGRVADRIRGLLAALDWQADWVPATDSFFDPQVDSKYLAQRLAALKTEVRYEELALCSLNLHGTFFGDAFAISRNGSTAHSACVAFGLERWLYVFASRFGPDVAMWPVPESLA